MGGVLRYLQEQNPDRYHEFIYELLIDINPITTDSLLFLLAELQSMEPQSTSSISVIQFVAELLEALQVPVDIRQLVILSEGTPFTFTVNTEKVKEMICEYASTSTLPQWIEISEALGIEKAMAVEGYIWEIVRDHRCM